VRRAFALCALLAASGSAAPPAPRPVPYLWASAPTPAGWELVHEHVWRPRGASGGPAIEAVFKEGEEALSWIRGEAEPTAFQRKTLGLSRVRAGRVEHRGPWLLVEVELAHTDGTTTRELDAALPAPAGIYAVTYFGRDPEYARLKDQALAFLDGFRRLPPPLRSETLTVPGRFSVSFPAAPWSTVLGDPDAEARAIAPASPGGGAPGLLSATALGADKDAGARFMEQTCGGAPQRARRTRAGVWMTAEAFSRARLTLADAPQSADGPRRSKCAVLSAGGLWYGLWWYAPPSAYDYGVPAFDEALATFRPR
jgi:hypothetical protein